MMLTFPSFVQRVIDRLEASGYEAYAVGGCVRDALLRKAPHDWDVTTAATPEEMLRVFAGEHVIETGLTHGTLTVRMEGQSVEVTTYRTESGYRDSRHPDEVTFSRSLDDDLCRRDFTINAMAYHPERGLIDLFGGREDLEAGLIRSVGEPERRMTEDALRILRGLRLASVLDFAVESQTADAIHALRERLSLISAERIYTEMTKMLLGAGVTRVLREFPDVLFVVCPELKDTFRFDQRNHHHTYDVYEHIIRTVEAVPAEPVLRWTMLLHDAGKPACFTLGEDGEGHFHGHPAVSAELAEACLTRLKTDRATRERVVQLILLHDERLDDTAACIKHILCRLGVEDTERLFVVKSADCAAKNPAFWAQNKEIDERAHLTMQTVLQNGECYCLADLAVHGEDWLAAGLPGGEAIGEGLRRLLNDVIDGKCPNEKSALLKRARTFYPKA